MRLVWHLEFGDVMLTATFFCESTTAQSFPRTPMAVMLAEVMALKAYSKRADDQQS